MKNRLKKLVITTGFLMLALGGPIVQNNPMGAYLSEMTGTITAQAAELPYSHRWETQTDGSWKYKMDDGSYALNRWVQDEVDGNWYLLDSSGTMKSGVYKSYGKYYLLSEVHDGHYGHLVVNGETYNGIVISADTSEEYKGALSSESLSALGVNTQTVEDVSGTQHTTNGQDVTGGGNTGGQQGNTKDEQIRRAEERIKVDTSNTNDGGGKVTWN